jgi:hypothetical protein
MLQEKRGLKAHEIYHWQSKIVKMNPHISDLNRIFPGESLLIPDTLHESVSRTRIWQNAFSKIPKALFQPHHSHTRIYFVQSGDTIDTVAKSMFSDSPIAPWPPATSGRC